MHASPLHLEKAASHTCPVVHSHVSPDQAGLQVQAPVIPSQKRVFVSLHLHRILQVTPYMNSGQTGITICKLMSGLSTYSNNESLLFHTKLNEACKRMAPPHPSMTARLWAHLAEKGQWLLNPYQFSLWSTHHSKNGQMSLPINTCMYTCKYILTEQKTVISKLLQIYKSDQKSKLMLTHMLFKISLRKVHKMVKK